jgi:ABC-type sugar transport system substrate-binding protein
MLNVRYAGKPGISLAGALVAACALAACSSSGAQQASIPAVGTAAAGSASADATLSPAVPAGYDGTDHGHFKVLAAPDIKSGASFKVGFLNTNASQPILLAMQDAAQAETAKLGGSFIALDAASNPQTQASQLQQLIAQHVNVIIGDPVVAAALGPGIAQARKAGIPFIAIGDPPDQADAPMPGAVTSVSQGFDYTVYRTMNALAAEHPGASFATMGFALPVDQLVFMAGRMKYWGEQLGLKFLGQVDTTSDNPTGFGPAASTILTKYPGVQIIVTFNDESAIAAATVVATSGKKVFVATPNAAEYATSQALKAHRLDLVYRTPWEQQGVESVIAGYDTVTKQDLPLPTFIDVPGYVVTPQTAAKAQWVS